MNDILSGTYKGNTYRIKVECYPNTPAIKVQLLPVNAGERITMTQNLGQPLPRYQAFLCDGMLEVDSTAFMDYMEKNDLGLHRGLQALRCRCIYRSKPQDCRRFSVPLRRAAPPEQSRLPALRRGLYATQAEARRTQSPTHGRIISFRARGNLFLCISGVNALHGLTDTIRALVVREVVEAMDIDQMTNPNVRKAALAMRKEVQKIPAFAIQSTHGTPCKGVDDSLLSRAATM